MESLALAVSIILGLILISGPLGIFLTSNPVWNWSLKNPKLWYLRRIVITTFSLVGLVVGFQVLFAGIAFTVSIMILSGMALNVFVLKTEYQIGKFNKRKTPATLDRE